MYESSGSHVEAADRFSEGMRMLNAGEYEAAVYAFSVAITLDPDRWTAFFRRGEAYRHLGLEEQANPDLERAEFLMAAARQETAENGPFLEGAGTDMSGGAFASAILGAVVGGIIGGAPAFFVITSFYIAAPSAALSVALSGGSSVKPFIDGYFATGRAPAARSAEVAAS